MKKSYHIVENRKNCNISDGHTGMYEEARNRRSFLRYFSSTLGVAFVSQQNIDPALAAAAATTTKSTKVKGAAEYDFEYYMRDLFKGNTKEGNVLPSQPPTPPPSRKMSPFIRNILDENGSERCITVRQLSKLTSVDTNTISSKILSFREKALKAFQVKEPWDEESVQDEYFFDLSCYSLFRVAADIIPSDYGLRDTWVRDVGREIYSQMTNEGYISVQSDNNGGKKNKLTSTIPILTELLNTFQSTKFVKGYRLGEKNDDLRSGINIFDQYDDEDIDSGSNVNFLLSVFRPATLGASLQVTGEGSRFSPDFVGSTVAAMFEKELGLRVEYESYFVDEEYRENPKDFFPEEQLLQFTLKKK